jgi:hypothetical protein
MQTQGWLIIYISRCPLLLWQKYQLLRSSQRYKAKQEQLVCALLNKKLNPVHGGAVKKEAI